MRRMRRFRDLSAAAFLLAVVMPASAADDDTVARREAARQTREMARVSRHYRQHRDHASLFRLFRHLETGMPRNRVEQLLGESDYSPIQGQHYYYAADAWCAREVDGPDAPCGIVVEYRRHPDYEVRGTLQSATFGPIGE